MSVDRNRRRFTLPEEELLIELALASQQQPITEAALKDRLDPNNQYGHINTCLHRLMAQGVLMRYPIETESRRTGPRRFAYEFANNEQAMLVATYLTERAVRMEAAAESIRQNFE